MTRGGSKLDPRKVRRVQVVRGARDRYIGKNVGSTTLRVPESSLTSVLTKPVVA